jgi:hypothetical protein
VKQTDDYSKPARDPRFGELDTLIAARARLNGIAEKRHLQDVKNRIRPMLTETEQEQCNERRARLKREADERARIRASMRSPGIVVSRLCTVPARAQREKCFGTQ